MKYKNIVNKSNYWSVYKISEGEKLSIDILTLSQ